MHGFLSHLAQRALQPQSELQPRLASRFEPLVAPVRSSADDLGAVGPEHDDEGPQSPDVGSVPHRDTTPPGASASDLSIRVADAVRVHRLPSVWAGDRLDAPSVPAPNATPRVEEPARARDYGHDVVPAPRTDARTVGDAGPKPRTAATRPTDQRAAGRIDVETVPADPLSAVTRRLAAERENVVDASRSAVGGHWVVRAAQQVPSATVERTESATDSRKRPASPPPTPPRARLADAGERTTHTPPGSITSPILQPIVAETRAVPPRVPREKSGAATDGPAIQVTIGRVEVRATVAPSPTRAAVPNKPALSLDEYLRQRSGAPR